MEFLSGIGILLALVGGLLAFAGVIMVLVGWVSSQKYTLKYGTRVLLAGAVSLLVSLTLCSASFRL